MVQNRFSPVVRAASFGAAAAVALMHLNTGLWASPDGWHVVSLAIVLATPGLVAPMLPLRPQLRRLVTIAWVGGLAALSVPVSLAEMRWPGHTAAIAFLPIGVLLAWTEGSHRPLEELPVAQRAVAAVAAVGAWVAGALVLFESLDPWCAPSFEVVQGQVIERQGPCVVDVITTGEATMAALFCAISLLAAAMGAAPIRDGGVRIEVQLPLVGLAKVAVIALSLLLLSSLGGAGVIVPLGLPVYLAFARRARTTAEAVAWTTLPSLGVLQLVWMATYLTVGEADGWIIAVPAVAWLVTQVALARHVIRSRRGARASAPDSVATA